MNTLPIARRTEIQDLHQCLQLAARDTPFLHGKTVFAAQVLDFWKALLNSGVAISAVIEDPSITPSKIIGFGMSVFVTNDFVLACRSAPASFLMNTLIAAYGSSQSPILDRISIRENNKPNSGLNLLGLHSSWDDKLAPKAGDTDPLVEEPAAYLRGAMLQSLYDQHAGYYIAYYFKEIYGTNELDRYLSFGMELWSNATYYKREEYDRHKVIQLPPSIQPYLVGITRKQALSKEREMCFARRLFSSYQAPRFSFTEHEQAILAYAGSGKSDTEIASIIGTNEGAIRQAFHRIFERVKIVDTNSTILLESTTGREKKRHKLLEYLRNHPEELCPHP